MLRSFQYKEKSVMDYSMENNLFRDKEIEIARRFALSHSARRNMDMLCPVCGSQNRSYFYTKWNVDYLRCQECKSIYAVVEERLVNEYQNNGELLDLRKSDAYQKQITESRLESWQEFVEWVSVRAFRFMHRNSRLKVVDDGNRLRDYSECIRDSELCSVYELRNSIIGKSDFSVGEGDADIVFCLDQLQKRQHPDRYLKDLKKYLKDDGILILNTRAGSGFDILTLKENNDKIYPYEHVLLPSVKGLTVLLNECGFEVLEITTPGVMDLKYVIECKDRLDPGEEFLRYLIEEAGTSTLQEFQRFLQKGCLSSFVCVIARRRQCNE